MQEWSDEEINDLINKTKRGHTIEMLMEEYNLTYREVKRLIDGKVYDRPLTQKEEFFCENYVIHFNGSRAAKDAGYLENSATVSASRLLRRKNIQDYVNKLIGEKRDRSKELAYRVVNELANMAFVQESEFYDDDGRVKRLSELTEEQKSALSQYGVKKVSTGDGGFEEVPVFRMHDKHKSLELLSKHFGLLQKEQDVSVTVNIDNKREKLKELKKELLGK